MNLRALARDVAIGLIAAGAALLVRWGLAPLLDGEYPFATSFLLIAITVWSFGWRAATCMMLIFYPAAHYFFAFPQGEFRFYGREDVLGMAIDISSLAILIYLGDKARTADRALLRANAELAETARHKDEFITILSHELRNPLAPIVMATRVLERAESRDEEKAEAVRILARQTRQMSTLLDDLLDQTRIARGRFELKRSFVDVRDCVETALQSHRELVEKKHQTLDVRVPESPVNAWVDEGRMTQIIANVIGNAVKFSQEKAQINVRLLKSADEISIQVSDNGPGIDPASLPHLFDLFYAVQLRNRSGDGFGIGLALTKGLVEMHGGHITVTSAGIGKGCECTIKLAVVEPAMQGDHEELSVAAAL